jgi:DNA topoisomerase I
MRTDSTNLSEDALKSAENEIVRLIMGRTFIKKRKYTSKSEGAQEAHEAIRPTEFSVTEAGKDSNETASL